MTRIAALGSLFGAIVLNASQAASVTARVVAADGAPIANARVRVAAAGHPATLLVTDADGRFPVEFPNVALESAPANPVTSAAR